MEPRNWKWMVPAGLFGLFLMSAQALLSSKNEWVTWLGMVLGLMAVICGIATIGNYFDYRRAVGVEMFERTQNARARTPVTAELEAARGLSPEVYKLMVSQRNRVWMMKSGVRERGIVPHSVLYGAPSVTDYFLRYVLENSSPSTVMQKNRLVEGRKSRFDPWGAVTEYQMYDDLMLLLVSQNKVVKWSDYSPYEWIHPWTPQLVAEDFGLEWEVQEANVAVSV